VGETVLTCGLSVAAKVKHGLFVLGAGGVRTWCQDVVSGRGGHRVGDHPAGFTV